MTGAALSDRLTLSRTAKERALALLWAALVAAVVWCMFDPMAQFFAFGVAASVIVTLPMLRTGYRLVEPWTFLALTVYFGHGVRGFFISYRGEDDGEIQQLFLLHQPLEFFVYPSAVHLGALALMALAYVGVRHRVASPTTNKTDGYKFGRQVDLIVVLTAAVGLVGSLLYVQATGGFSWDLLSAKRTTIPGVELAGYEGGHGVYRTVAQFGTVAFLLAVARSSVTHGSIPAGTGRWLWMTALFANAALVPLHSSTRADVVLPLVFALVVRSCLGRRRLRVRTLIQVAAVGVVMLAALTFLRATAEGAGREVTGVGAVDALGDTLVYNRNFGELPVTAHIIGAVPEKMGYTHGETVVTYLAGPIPRTVWRDKPLISPGPIIGAKIYGLPRSGVPPGAVGEFYWAFGIPGVVAGSLMLGWLLRLIDRRFNPADADPRRVLLYAAALMPFAINAMAVSLGYALLSATIAFVMMSAALTLAGARHRATSRPSRYSRRRTP